MARSRPVASGQGRHRPFSLDPHFTPPLQWLAPRAWIGDLCHGVSELAADGRPFSWLLPCPSSFLLPPSSADGGPRTQTRFSEQCDWTSTCRHPDSCAAGLDWTRGRGASGIRPRLDHVRDCRMDSGRRIRVRMGGRPGIGDRMAMARLGCVPGVEAFSCRLDKAAPACSAGSWRVTTAARAWLTPAIRGAE